MLSEACTASMVSIWNDFINFLKIANIIGIEFFYAFRKIRGAFLKLEKLHSFCSLFINNYGVYARIQTPAQGGENCQNPKFFTTKMVIFLPKRFFWFFMSNSFFHAKHYSKAHFELNTVLYITCLLLITTILSKKRTLS